MAIRRPALSALLIALVGFQASSWLFVNTFPAATQRGSRVAARVSAGYLERLGPKDTDTPFNAAAAAPGMDVEFKKRPFGILRYQPG
eukprot:CAMPEP_0178404984 /NCGR_PEP_ID=MMETSP0689_2-20121128/18168_1 /TAXON_ID=160604 /ORGANISM="Amphidinium massartii, Strain CS-259" /LENGTH=86 /DNA_ID=CAMNT_0020025991 /DNA_START=84 /DNA_END=340 /DNA_ORIENTATION=+